MPKNASSLSVICLLIVDCEHKTAPTQETGHPSIRTPNIGRGRLILEGVNRVSEKIYKEWTRRAIPQENDIILAREAPVGNAALIPPNLKICLGQRTVLIRPDPEKVYPQYLVYLLLGDEIQNHFHAYASGVTVPHLNMHDIRALPLPQLHEIEDQYKIAFILSTYDDLIENNTRRIRILEDMAQTIYREWFVHFRFPGHEDVKMVESELGMIPEGWEVLPIENVARLFRGKSYRSIDLSNDGIPFINLKCFNKEGGFRKSGLKSYIGKYKEAQTARTGDIVIALTDMTQERRIIARAARVPETGHAFFVMSMDLLRLDPKEGYDKTFLYCYLRFSQFPDDVKQFANGVNVLHLSPDRIKEYKVIIPTEDLMFRYGGIVEPLYQEMDILDQKNENLHCTRDLLLPRLISGKLDVSELNIGKFKDAN